jgi:hypothetical protein
MIMETETKAIRPLGIAILSWLHMIGGAVGVTALFLANAKAQEAVAATGMSADLVTCVAVLFCAFSFACGVGMWMGRIWGWYLGSFYWMYSLLTSVNALIPMPSAMNAAPSNEALDTAHGPVFYYVTHGVRAAIGVFLYSYFFKSNVRSFFGVTEGQKWNTFLPEVGICLGIIIVTGLVMQLGR